MSKHNDLVSVRQMLDHAQEALELVGGRTQQAVVSNRNNLLALLQLLQIIGEAAKRVSPEWQARHTEIPWAQIIALRNRIVHGYDDIDLEALWKILSGDLPVLAEALRKIIQAEPPQ